MLDHLVAPPTSIPFPEGGETALVEAADGVRLRMAFFAPADQPAKGTVFVVQGRAEFIEKFGEVFTRLLARGFAIATLDLRGQGGSGRQLRDPRKGHVEDFDDYLLDFDALIGEADRRKMPRPYGLLAHSTGGAIALLALARGHAPFERAILTSPLVAIAGLPTKTGARLLARVLSSIGLSGFYVPTGGARSIFEKPFEGNPLTRDPTRYGWSTQWVTAEPALAVGDPTIGWVDAAFDALARFEDDDFGQANRTPLLILTASADTVVDAQAAAALAGRMRGASTLSLTGARHEILMETDAIQAEFWAAFDAFMQLSGEPAAPACKEH